MAPAIVRPGPNAMTAASFPSWPVSACLRSGRVAFGLPAPAPPPRIAVTWPAAGMRRQRLGFGVYAPSFRAQALNRETPMLIRLEIITPSPSGDSP